MSFIEEIKEKAKKNLRTIVFPEGDERRTVQAASILQKEGLVCPILLGKPGAIRAAAEQTGADLFEILPADDHYPMTYAELTDVAKQEQNERARPAYAGELPELSQYDTVFIGAPVWWGDWPMILYTVFENNDFSGKTLIPFSTHEGSGLSGFDRKLASACPDSTVLDGLAVRGNEAQNDREQVQSAVKDWIAGLGF